jgi:TolB-like protein/DNA-binding winged helix-turn-helix (wHTH) protein
LAKYYFGRCELDTDRHQLAVAGIPRHIEPQVFDLLKLFVERGDRLVSHEDLIAHIWHGRIVTDSAISVRISAARKAVGDNGTEQAIIQTIPRRGFKLAVNAIRVDSGIQQETSGPIRLSGEPDLFPEHDDRPVLAVFRFECTGDENPQDYLGRGIADDIATELSRFHTITVISTYSTFKHDTATGDTAEFSASLGATHIITGSIQTIGSQLRLTARLGDADTNKNIWSERYDISLNELFEAQDDVVANIVGNLFSRLHDYQMSVARQKPTNNLSAYDCVLRGLKIYKSGHVAESEAKQTLFWLDRAVELDPHYARALAWRACAGSNFWSNPPTGEDLEAPMKNMKLAMSVDPGDHEVHRLKGALHVIQGQFELGDYHLAKSVELNPNDAQILLRIGYYRSFLGDRYNDLNYIDLAFRRNPLHPDWYWHDRGVVLFAHGDYRGSLNSLLRCQDGIEAGHVYQAACYAALGETSRAASIIGTVCKLNNALSLDWIELAYPYRCYKSSKSMNKLTSLLAVAGLK